MQIRYCIVVLAVISTPANNDRSPRYAEKAFAAIHEALRPSETIQLEYGLHEGRVSLLCQFPGHLREAVLGPLIANYPRATITVLDGDADLPQPRPDEWSCDVRLEPELFPILRHAQFEDLLNGAYADPIDSLLHAVRPTADGNCRVEIKVTPATPRLCRKGKQAVEILDREFFRSHPRLADFFARHVLRPRTRWILWLAKRTLGRARASRGAPLDVSAGRIHDREADLQAAADKIGGHLFTVSIRIVVQAPSVVRARERVQAVIGALGAFTRSRLATFTAAPLRRATKKSPKTSGFIVSHEELATLWHPPTAAVGAEQMHVSAFTELEPPASFYSGDEPGAVTLGQVQFRDDQRPVGLALNDRRRHLYVIGGSGTGKTTLLFNLIFRDLLNGHALSLIDPHGDLADAVLSLAPQSRTNDIIVLDAGDREYAVGFNPLACPDSARIDQVAGGVVAAFKKLHDSWGPRLEDTLRNAVFAIVEQRGTLLSLLQLLGDTAYRERLVPQIRDPVVRAFWQQEFAGWSKAYRTEAVAAIQNKVRPFLTSPTMRAIVSQTSKTLDLRSVMDQGKVLIVNLSKGRIGEDNSALLGALLVTSLQQAAMTRADVAEEARRDFHLYVDEFQNFATSSFAVLLSEARKFRVTCVLSHQFLGQLDETVAAAVTGNVGSIVAFAVGGNDAEVLAVSLSHEPGQLTSQDLTNLPRHTACVRLLVDGTPSAPFTLRTLPPPISDADRRSIVVNHSRRQYAQPTASILRQVEKQLAA